MLHRDNLEARSSPVIGGGRSSFAVMHSTGELVIELGGELDAATAPALWEAVEGSTRLVDGRTTVLDLSGVAFIDSSGLQLVVRLAHRVELRGSVLVVRNPRDLVRRLLEVAGIVSLVRLEPKVASAGRRKGSAVSVP